MSASLFVERHEAGLAFYINGNLQFDTADEAIYHEYLVIPAIALAVQRFPNIPLRVLVCGGGDGLAVRDSLRFPEVRDVTVVDYDPEVLELGRTEFAAYNQGSLRTDTEYPMGTQRVAVYTQDAFAFVQQLPDTCYQVVIGDFTCPTRPEEMTVLSLEWFTQVRRVLAPQGVFALNGVSPDQTPTAYWCLYQTLMAAGFNVKPMQLSIPSFERLKYGVWGFFLAAAEPISRSALAQVRLPANLNALTLPDLLDTFRFPGAIASFRHNLKLNTLTHPHLFYYLLNPPEVFLEDEKERWQRPCTGPLNPPSLGDFEDDKLSALEEVEDQNPPNLGGWGANAGSSMIAQTTYQHWVDFLDLSEIGTGQDSTTDEMQLDAIAKRWLTLTQHSDFNGTDLHQLQSLIPVQHFHQKPEMMREWLSYGKSLLAEVDPKALSEALLARSQSLPPKLVQDLKEVVGSLRTGQPLAQLSSHTTELITVLTVTLLMANIATPEAVFAKGFSGGSSSHSSGGSSSIYYGDSGYDADGGGFGWFGFWMMAIGGVWLYGLYQNPEDES